MSRRSGAVKTSYPCLLLASDPEQEKKTVDASYAAAPSLDEKEKIFQAGGPLWAGIWLFLMHVIMGIFLSSFSYIPYVGESPAWFRASMFVATLIGGFCDHLGAYIAHLSKLETLRNVSIQSGLLSVIFFFCKICTVFSPWESTALVLFTVALSAVPVIAYKKVTGKDVPTDYHDVVDSLSTWAGLIVHLAGDTNLAIFFAVCWRLMDCPALLHWLQ